METAHALVAERFPNAIAAFLGDTVLTTRRTATSDLDIVVLVAGEAPPYREMLEYRRWLVELFVHTPVSFAQYVAREVAARRSPLLHMCGRGALLADVDGVATRIREAARARLDVGPAPVATTELEDRRYGLSGLADDFADAQDPDEMVFIATRLLVEAAELVLLTHGAWLGTGKWLVRQLRQTDAALSGQLLAAYRAAVGSNHREPLQQVVQQVLDGAGGRLMAGYHRQGRLLQRLASGEGGMEPVALPDAHVPAARSSLFTQGVDCYPTSMAGGAGPSATGGLMRGDPLPIEELLREVWEELLGVQHLGIDDDVFDVGAHSLTVMWAAARILERTGLDLPIRWFYEEPTVAGQARLIAGMPSGGSNRGIR